jgi:hypothetical protein
VPRWVIGSLLILERLSNLTISIEPWDEARKTGRATSETFQIPKLPLQRLWRVFENENRIIRNYLSFCIKSIEIRENQGNFTIQPQ